MAQLQFFGKLADLAGSRTRLVDLNRASSIDALIASIANNDAALATALREQSVRYAVNDVICSVEMNISDSDNIAFLPPVSGG